ncbi:Uncharacterized protein FKW44_007453, partial [Caligus rogercresseyi]
MEIPDFRPYFLIRIKLARTVNEIHGTRSLPSLTPTLASPPSRDGTLSSIRVFLPWRRRSVLEVPGELALISLLAFNNVDTAAITETEFNEEQSASFEIENYTTFLALADGDGKRRIV